MITLTNFVRLLVHFIEFGTAEFCAILLCFFSVSLLLLLTLLFVFSQWWHRWYCLGIIEIVLRWHSSVTLIAMYVISDVILNLLCWIYSIHKIEWLTKEMVANEEMRSIHEWRAKRSSYMVCRWWALDEHLHIYS